MLQAGMIVGGWDKYEGGQIYSVPLGGTILRQPFSIGGIMTPFMEFYLTFCQFFYIFSECLIHVHVPYILDVNM